MNVADLARRAAKAAVDNSPHILTAIGVVGTVTTAYLAGKASFQAADIIRLKEGSDEERGITVPAPKELMKERIKLVWQLYIPAIATGTMTVACIVGANRVSASRAAGLAAAYGMTEKAFGEYKAKVVEQLGARKEEAIRDEIAQDRVSETYLDGVPVFGLIEGQLCYDKWSDRYFRNTVEGIRAAENDLNYALLHDNYASADDFYTMLGLPSPTYAYAVGWNSDRMLEIQISTTVAPGDIPCLVMNFKNEPKPDYDRFH